MKEAHSRPITAAFQGEHGAFSETAARQLLGEPLRTLPCRTFEEMFEAVAQGNADAALAPIENSLAGSVHKNYDLLMEHDLTIIGETTLRIVHNLITLPGVNLADVQRVHSHPVALAQCERFLRAHPQLEVIPAYDTAGSVREIVRDQRAAEAAIAGVEAANFYGAQIVAESIEDNPQNFTRFLLLARPEDAARIPTTATGRARKISLVVRLANRPGSLFRALAALALRDIDLTKIESRPIEGRPWEYSFYLDFIGDTAEPHIERALAHLAEMSESIRLLGCYPQSTDNRGKE